MQTLEKVSLFWDVKLQELDLKIHRDFILERILTLGDLEDVRWAKKIYGKKEMKLRAQQSRQLDPKSVSFWSQYFNFSPTKCTQKQSPSKLT